MKRMKLSEAIRLGATMTTPSMCWMHIDRRDGEVQACLLGAALYAVGVRPENTGCYTNEVHKRFPILNRLGKFVCHVIHEGETEPCGERFSSRFNFALHLHDDHMEDWDREQIADWIAKNWERKPAKRTTKAAVIVRRRYAKATA